ncbi:MarR family winged helix-turn-helix transcriptional regulator [Dehalobacter sp. DCM]|uniref:MarR family winged helix-turn-helix transcriptional regulator n=1 Tax=Dehalobacter sp. DCM TaxID=2907827 RepID=UPI003081F0F9|nr:MarR family winged helix-turn-helix transcriptional regulator [Dehalobacter sp. DCM]
MRTQYTGMPHLKKNHIKILNILCHTKELTPTRIGKKLDIEKGSLTSLIDQLEAWDLVARSEDINDRRKSLISLSAKGKEEMRTLMQFYANNINSILHNYDAKEVEQFITDLRNVVIFMNKL